MTKQFTVTLWYRTKSMVPQDQHSQHKVGVVAATPAGAISRALGGWPDARLPERIRQNLVAVDVRASGDVN